MNVNPKYLIYHDLIGLYALARLKSKSGKNEFLNIGMVIDDTRNMLITENNGITRKYIKKNHVFRFNLPKNKEDEERFDLEVIGDKIVGCPENRIRSLKKKKWLRK